MIEMEPFRLRLKFDNSVLSDSQKSDGLKRSWVLVQPAHHTISDLVSYLLHAFNLSDSCPHGIFLSVEGFALPHFESILILGNTDIACVKRKGSELCLEQKVDKRSPFTLGMPVPVSEDIEKEARGFQSETEVIDEDVQTDLLEEEDIPNRDAPIMKRKASKQLKNSKKKRKCRKYDSSSPPKENCDCYLQNEYYLKKSSKSKQDQGHNQINTDKCEGAGPVSSEPYETVKASVPRSTRRRKMQKQRWQVAEQLCKKNLQGKGLEDEDHLTISDHKKKDVQQYQEAKESLNWRDIRSGKKRCKKKQSYNKKQPSSIWSKSKATQDKQPTCSWNENRPPQETEPANTWGSGSGWRAETPGSTGMNMTPASTSENGCKDVWEEISAKKAESLQEDNWNSRKRKSTNYTWSYRTLRSRALCLDMPLLRPQNHAGAGLA